jgi:hypothetical protein
MKYIGIAAHPLPSGEGCHPGVVSTPALSQRRRCPTEVCTVRYRPEEGW